MNYTILIVSPPGYIHSQCFTEVAESLRDAIKGLGHGCEVSTDPRKTNGRLIVLGAHLLSMSISYPILPLDTVLYNLEQVDWHSIWMNDQYIDLLSRYEVWDYCDHNVHQLAQVGVRAKKLTIGYMPCLEKVPEMEEDIDFLFVGSMSNRRQKILEELHLQLNKARIIHLKDSYSSVRDEYIGRSKVILNIHFYPANLFEIVRCSYMMANKRCIVSEDGVGTEGYEDAIHFTSYNNIVSTCVGIFNGTINKKIGYDIFKAKRFNLEDVL